MPSSFWVRWREIYIELCNSKLYREGFVGCKTQTKKKIAKSPVKLLAK